MDAKKAKLGVIATALLGFLGTAATYCYKAETKCMDEANSAITEYTNLRVEIAQRIYFLAEALDRSPTVAELGKQVAPVRSFLAAYKDKNTSELLQTENALELRFDPFSSIRFQLTQTLDAKTLFILDSLLSGAVPSFVSDNDRKFMEDLVVYFSNTVAAQGNVTLWPRCGILQTVPIIFGYRPQIVDKLPM